MTTAGAAVLPGTSCSEDAKTQDAVIRQFEVIGEAVKHFPGLLKVDEPAIPWRQFAGCRDFWAYYDFAVEMSVV